MSAESLLENNILKHCGVQASVLDPYPLGSVLYGLETNSNLSTLTGLESFSLLDTIIEIVKKVAKPDSLKTKIGLRERIIMTYTKLKQNVSYALLAIMFQLCSERHCRPFFFQTVQLLSASLRVFTRWPGREQIESNIPKCFEYFQDVVVILDCTEIFIQQSSSLKNQILTYSLYKGANTCKIMTGVSPSGNITFVSEIYGG